MRPLRDPLKHFSRHNAFVKLLALCLVQLKYVVLAVGPILWFGWFRGWW
jgi:hypothetical protein